VGASVPASPGATASRAASGVDASSAASGFESGASFAASWPASWAVASAPGCPLSPGACPVSAEPSTALASDVPLPQPASRISAKRPTATTKALSDDERQLPSNPLMASLSVANRPPRRATPPRLVASRRAREHDAPRSRARATYISKRRNPARAQPGWPIQKGRWPNGRPLHDKKTGCLTARSR